MLNSFQVLPSYYSGHLFVWSVAPAFTDPLPWSFIIQCSPDGLGTWENFLGPFENIFQYHDRNKPLKYDKGIDPFYRVVMTTGTGRSYESAIKGTYGDLPRRDYLIAKEMMRREQLMMIKSSGVEVGIWKMIKTGIRCAHCTDEVTGIRTSTKCPYCLGSEYEGGYTGPYGAWAKFSERKSDRKFDAGGYGVTEPGMFMVTLLGHPFLNDGDVLVDKKSDRRYSVANHASTVEIRRLPILITAGITELSMADVEYKLGEQERDDDACGNSRVY